MSRALHNFRGATYLGFHRLVQLSCPVFWQITIKRLEEAASFFYQLGAGLPIPAALRPGTQRGCGEEGLSPPSLENCNW